MKFLQSRLARKIVVILYIVLLVGVSVGTCVSYARYLSMKENQGGSGVSPFACSFSITDLSSTAFANADYWFSFSDTAMRPYTSTLMRNLEGTWKDSYNNSVIFDDYHFSGTIKSTDGSSLSLTSPNNPYFYSDGIVDYVGSELSDMQLIDDGNMKMEFVTVNSSSTVNLTRSDAIQGLWTDYSDSTINSSEVEFDSATNSFSGILKLSSGDVTLDQLLNTYEYSAGKFTYTGSQLQSLTLDGTSMRYSLYVSRSATFVQQGTSTKWEAADGSYLVFKNDGTLDNGKIKNLDDNYLVDVGSVANFTITSNTSDGIVASWSELTNGTLYHSLLGEWTDSSTGKVLTFTKDSFSGEIGHMDGANFVLEYELASESNRYTLNKSNHWVVLNSVLPNPTFSEYTNTSVTLTYTLYDNHEVYLTRPEIVGVWVDHLGSRIVFDETSTIIDGHTVTSGTFGGKTDGEGKIVDELIYLDNNELHSYSVTQHTYSYSTKDSTLTFAEVGEPETSCLDSVAYAYGKMVFGYSDNTALNQMKMAMNSPRAINFQMRNYTQKLDENGNYVIDDVSVVDTQATLRFYVPQELFAQAAFQLGYAENVDEDLYEPCTPQYLVDWIVGIEGKKSAEGVTYNSVTKTYNYNTNILEKFGEVGSLSQNVTIVKESIDTSGHYRYTLTDSGTTVIRITEEVREATYSVGLTRGTPYNLDGSPEYTFGDNCSNDVAGAQLNVDLSKETNYYLVEICMDTMQFKANSPQAKDYVLYFVPTQLIDTDFGTGYSNVKNGDDVNFIGWHTDIIVPVYSYTFTTHYHTANDFSNEANIVPNATVVAKLEAENVSEALSKTEMQYYYVDEKGKEYSMDKNTWSCTVGDDTYYFHSMVFDVKQRVYVEYCAEEDTLRFFCTENKMPTNIEITQQDGTGSYTCTRSDGVVINFGNIFGNYYYQEQYDGVSEKEQFWIYDYTKGTNTYVSGSSICKVYPTEIKVLFEQIVIGD